MQKVTIAISAFILALGIALAGFFVGDSIVLSKQSTRYVTVKGLAEKIVQSDEAIWQMRFNYASDELDGLYKGIAESQQKIKSFLLQKGFEVKSIQMLPISVTDRANQSFNSNQKAKRYNATSGIVLKSGKIDAVKKAIQNTGELVKLGVVLNSSYVQYIYNKLNNIKPNMLILATENAKKAAQIFAKNSDSALGKIKWASQGIFSIYSANPAMGDRDSFKKVRVVTTVQYILK